MEINNIKYQQELPIIGVIDSDIELLDMKFIEGCKDHVSAVAESVKHSNRGLDWFKLYKYLTTSKMTEVAASAWSLFTNRKAGLDIKRVELGLATGNAALTQYDAMTQGYELVTFRKLDEYKRVYALHQKMLNMAGVA